MGCKISKICIIWCSLKPIFVVKQCRGAKNLFLLSDFIIFVGIKFIKMEKNSIETDKKFMRFAIEEARRALKEQEVPIGAVVVCGDRVIGRGHNLVETLCDATAHAEMQAITAAAEHIGGKYLDFYQGNTLAWAGGNIQGKELYRILCENSALSVVTTI